ncbi:far upstream element-binding protein 2 isoform X1 [Salvia hispanica]|uniref:far upstream element-binding protein 2 isoform X1 n=1 Tax=Salvia hispanica TaxID=49212 RepID=UPI0020095751|nr:far upstream element-binding protein 2 isoform X1 [Salvia hispanica]
MADESVITPPEASPAASAAGDGLKRKLEEIEQSDAPAAVTEPENTSDIDALKSGSQEEGNGGVDESEAKRPRLESNGDDVAEADGSAVPQNGHTEEGKEEEPEVEKEEETKEEKEEETKEEKEVESKEEKEDEPKEESEKPETEDDNGQSLGVQEPVKEPQETATVETAPSDTEKTDVGSAEEAGQPNAESEEEPSNLPREGDVPVQSADRLPGSDTILSRKMEVPNDKVGVLIGKAGDTIRSLQDNSGAKIQIVRDADADPRAVSRPLELVGTLESINRAERLIKGVIAEADAGGSPSLVARGFNTAQAASGGELLEIQVPVEKVGLIIGKGGETIRNLQTRSGARIQLIQPNGAADQSSEKMVRVTGNKKQIDTAREMIKEVMNQTVSRPSPLSGGYNQQGYRPRGPPAPQWGPRSSHHAQYSGYDYPHRGQYPSQSSQYPPPYGNYPPPQAPRNFGPSWEQRPPASMHGPPPQGGYNYGQQQGPDYGHSAPYPQAPSQPYGHGYNEAKYDHPASAQHYGHMSSQPTPYAQGGAHSGYGHQDQYNKPPMYGVQPQAPHSESYGQPRPNQPGEAPYQGPGSATQTYGQNMPSQQSYPYVSSAPMQQSYPSYGGTTDGYGHTPTAASASAYPPQGGQPGYGQPGAQQPPAYSQAAPVAGGYGSYPTAQPGYAEQPAANNTAYGYQGSTDPAYGATQATAAYPATAAAQSGYAQTQPTYDQSGGYGNVPTAAATYGKSASPKAAYQQYDSSQMYGAHR